MSDPVHCCWIIHTKANGIGILGDFEWFGSDNALRNAIRRVINDRSSRLFGSSPSAISDVLNKTINGKLSFIRRDRHVWSTTIVAFNDTSSIVIDSGGDRLYLNLREGDKDYEVYFLGGQGDELDYVRGRSAFLRYNAIKSAVSSPLPGPRANILVFRSDRVGDALNLCAKLDWLHSTHPTFRFDRLIFQGSMAMLDPRAVHLAPLFKVTEEVEAKAKSSWDIYCDPIGPWDNIIESLSFPLYEDRRLWVAHMRKIVPLLAKRQRHNNAGELRLLISFELEKRVWKNQVEGLAALLNRLTDRFPVVFIMVNGMTAPASGPEDHFYSTVADRENAAIAELASRANTKLKFESLFGLTLLEKARKIATCDYFLCPVGSAAMLPAYLAVPGTVFGAPAFMDSDGWTVRNLANVTLLPSAYIQAIEGDLGAVSYEWSRDTFHGTSYQIDSEIFASVVYTDIVNWVCVQQNAADLGSEY